MSVSVLSTVDNPYDPFTQWDDWFHFDQEHGYNSCSVLARACPQVDGLPDEVASRVIDEAIDTILSLDRLNIYVKKQSQEA